MLKGGRSMVNQNDAAHIFVSWKQLGHAFNILVALFGVWGRQKEDARTVFLQDSADKQPEKKSQEAT